MKKIIVIAVLLLSALFYGWTKFTTPLGDQKVDYTPASKECSQENGFHYCIYKAKNGTNGNIAYHLHGRNLSENTWNDDTYYTSMLQKYWDQKNVNPPTVVSISYGAVWLLTPKGSSSRSGLLEMTKDLITKVESTLGAPKERILIGESMGGFNSLVLGLSYPGFFDRIASLCPVLYKVSPFTSWSILKETIERTGANPKNILGLVQLAKLYVANDAEWSKVSPLSLLENYSGKAPKLYLSCGLYDKYGNFEGVELFANNAIKKGFQVEWHPLYGGHCAVDTSSVAEFVAPSERNHK